MSESLEREPEPERQAGSAPASGDQPQRRPWRDLASAQGGLVTRRQLRELGWTDAHVRANVAAQRWVARSSVVIGTTTGILTREQLMWLGVLHAGPAALIGDLTAAEVAGLRNWHRDEITVLVPRDAKFHDEVPGVRFVRTRRPLAQFRARGHDLPVARIEPAILHFAAYQRSTRTAEGCLAAAVQQRLTSADELMLWIDRLRPLRWSRRLRGALQEIGGGAHSTAELDIRRVCKRFGLRPPMRQTKRRDASGRVRFTDCEWLLPDGRILVLEVDGGFHMEVEHWEDDISRQRQLSAADRIIVRCTGRELRDEPQAVARDLLRIGVPRAA